MIKNKNAFTLVELVVVTIILIILGTIAFFAYLGYTSDANNSVKVSNFKNLDDKLELYYIDKGTLPLPENKVNVTYGGKNIWYQGTIGKDFINKILNLGDGFVDKEFGIDYTYSVLAGKLDQFQLGTVVKGENVSYLNNFISSANANALDYTSYIVGNYNGKLIDDKNLKLLMPGIILSDLSNINLNYNSLIHIATNDSYNLPSSYSGVINTLTGGLLTAVKKGQQNLGIYYGFPSILNYPTNNRDLDKVTEDFNQYKYIVLGAGLEDSSHSDHDNMVTIVSNYIGISYGYVSINQDYSDITDKVDNWEASGVDGIFLDEDGYDYLVGGGLFSNNIDARNHQNSVYDYIHSKGLKIIVNGWKPDDIFGTLSGESKTTLNSEYDGYLFESFTFNILKNPINDFRNQQAKIETILKYKKEFHFDLHCVGMLNQNSDISLYDVKTFYKNSKGLCNSIQLTNSLFSASGIDNGLMINFFKDY